MNEYSLHDIQNIYLMRLHIHDNELTVDDGEVGLKVLELLLGLGTDEHVGHKVLRPGHLVDEANFALRLGRGADEAVEDVCPVQGVEVGHRLVV